ncbi:MAG: hypothetical protein WCH61_10680 [bacterium]
MRYDLNFWPEVDWRRESSIDPRFLTAVGICLLALAFLGVWSWSYADLQACRTELQAVTAANEKIKASAEDVTRQNQCLANWAVITAKLKHKEAQRLPWSTQLAALTSTVPASVLLNQLMVRSQQLKIEVLADPVSLRSAAAVADGGAAPAAPRPPPVRKPRSSLRLQYELTLIGVAVGEGADDVITRFSRDLPRHPEIAPWLDSVELTGVEPELRAFNGRPGKRFTIVCKYRPIDWYDESTKVTP